MPAETRVPRPWRIGLAAHLDDGGSAHTHTFERALDAALRRPGPSSPPAELHLACDGASAARADDVARRFVAARVDVVVGHFASAAAAAAAPHYERAGLPLLLPAATAPALTAHGNVFRLCPHDGAILAATLAWLAQPQPWRTLCVLDDGSASACAFATAVRGGASRRAGVRLVATVRDAQALFFAGRQHAAIELVRALGDALPAHLMLSDDAIHPATAAELGARGRSAVAFGLDVAQRGTGVYFAETRAAVEIALALRAHVARSVPPLEALHCTGWPTVLGTVRFTAGEHLAARVARWRLGPAGAHVEASAAGGPGGAPEDAAEFDRKARSALRPNPA